MRITLTVGENEVKEVIITIVAVFLILMNILGFATMGIDKRRAIKNKWRIREHTLLLIAFLGGGIGSFLGMRIFHHKTKHKKFIILVPLAAILYALIVIKIILFL